jgi:hypothetical protein
MPPIARAAAKQHAEWLSLVEISGPFLSLSVLNQTFAFGLDAHNPELYRAVKEAYEEWEDSSDPAIHNAWIRFLLTTVLGYPDDLIGQAQGIPESAVAVLELQNARIRPDLAILDPDNPGRVKLPILVYPRTQKLDSPCADAFAASPHTRMQMLLQNVGLQAGFVTNGAEWSLVHVRKGEQTGFATWRTELLTEEKLLLQSFTNILGLERTLGAPKGQTLFDLLDRSAQDQEEVTKELGRQVREAVEVFVNAVDRLDRDSRRTLLAGLAPRTVYDGALTVMMRLIFLLCAEERGLMDGRELYVRHYSVSELNDQLREIASGEEQVLEHRHDAWMRLLATFRLVHGGCRHEDMNLPAYGGSLFDPDRYRFLENCRIDDRVVLHLLDALEFLSIRVPGAGSEKRRLSFRALGVEQIGHVYEGLLDHRAVRASEAVVGLTGRETEEEEIALTELEANRDELGRFFEKRKIKISGNPDRLLNLPVDPEKASKLHRACVRDETLYDRALPFLSIIREDSLEHIQIYPEGSLYVTAGADRRSSGTHYTPVSLTEEVVRYALEPLVYVGPVEGLPSSDWKLRSAREIVDLKVCDMAMGSGAFLVQACRYLSERLVEAWGEALKEAQRPLGFSNEGDFFTQRVESDHVAKKPGTIIETPFGTLAVAEPTAELISNDPEERLAQAKRIVADRCLYGVDINPRAVDIAKLSLWLTTMRRDRPFTFLDHALRVGDSLMAVNLRQLEAFNMFVDKDKRLNTLLLPWVPARVRELRQFRRQILAIPSHDSEAITRKQLILDKFNRVAESLRFVADKLLRTELDGGSRKEKEKRRLSCVLELGTTPAKIDSLIASGEPTPEEGRFHWELEFPDALLDDSQDLSNARAGFDAFIGNPPFIGGQKITGLLGTTYRDFLVTHLANGKNGSADLCAYFFLNAAGQLKALGASGLIATNTIAQGDTREVGLEQVVQMGYTIPRANKSTKWPGSANLEISQVWMFRGHWREPYILDGKRAATITPFLDDGSASGKPFRLKANDGLSFIGSYVLGMGFVMTPEESQALIERNPANKEVLFPYLNGEDLNSRPDQSPSRWVINFYDWPLGRVGQKLPFSGESVLRAIRSTNTRRSDEWFPRPNSRWESAGEERRQKWLQLGVVPDDYDGFVAADFPDCLEIVERLVRPERAENKRDQRRLRWWQFAERAPELYKKLLPLRRCLATSLVGQYVSVGFCPTGIVFAHRLGVFPLGSNSALGLLQSAFHYHWAWTYSSTMRIDLNYSPSDCFETFPIPEYGAQLEEASVAFEVHRDKTCNDLEVGLTGVARLTHDPRCDQSLIVEFRHHIIEMDLAVRNAYDWQDIDLGHGFHGEGRDRRFTISPAARQEVLRRLLKLNHARYEEEVAAGLHDKPSKRKGGKTGDDALEALSGPRANLFDQQPRLGERS